MSHPQPACEASQYKERSSCLDHGHGLTAEWLANHHDARVTAVTISAAQAQRAAARGTGSPLLTFLQQDWLENTFQTGSFDRVTSIVSSEHMPDNMDGYRECATKAGFATDSFEDLSTRVRRTWAICARRVARKLLAQVIGAICWTPGRRTASSP
jgi:tocopherol O-methyltransferase